MTAAIQRRERTRAECRRKLDDLFDSLRATGVLNTSTGKPRKTSGGMPVAAESRDVLADVPAVSLRTLMSSGCRGASPRYWSTPRRMCTRAALALPGRARDHVKARA